MKKILTLLAALMLLGSSAVLQAQTIHTFGNNLKDRQGYATTIANDVIGGRMNPVPEPATMALVGIGLLGLAGIARRRFPSVS